ncbi:MAG: hypothetical protein KA715_07185 [Xanthomonadaceae bacterium]|nr:hypothetical protein [Xanthomonadaceae bacterium]
MNSFIKITKGMLFILLLIVSVSAQAQQSTKGGGSPGPFEDANTHAELADGETYYLKGTVVLDLDEKDLYLEIDFKDHPWLANKRRIKSPFYRIENNAKFNLGKFVGKKILLNFKAKLEFYEDVDTDKLSVDIALKPLSIPKLIRK